MSRVSCAANRPCRASTPRFWLGDRGARRVLEHRRAKKRDQNRGEEQARDCPVPAVIAYVHARPNEQDPGHGLPPLRGSLAKNFLSFLLTLAGEPRSGGSSRGPSRHVARGGDSALMGTQWASPPPSDWTSAVPRPIDQTTTTPSPARCARPPT